MFAHIDCEKSDKKDIKCISKVQSFSTDQIQKCLICNILTARYYFTVTDVSIIPQRRILDDWHIQLEKTAAINLTGGLLQGLAKSKPDYPSNFDEIPLG